MVFTYSEAALKVAIAQLAQNIGWHGIGSNSFEILIDLCSRYVREIGKLSTCFANQYNRTQVNFDDLQLAFNTLGISINELEDYYTHVDAIPFVKGNLAKYPVKVKNVRKINYPDQNELSARAEHYEEWMPSIKLDNENDNLLNPKLNKDNEINDDALNNQTLDEEEMDRRYLASLKNQIGPNERIGGFTELSALVPNYIYLTESGQALSYGGKSGKLPDCKLPPLTEEDRERMEQEEEKRKQELQKEKEKTFQPLKLKINNKEKFRKYLKDPKLKGRDYMSKELLKRAKKDKKLKPKMNLSKLSITMSLNQNSLNRDRLDDSDSLQKQKLDLLETAEKLGLSSEIDELKKLNKLKEKNIKEKKVKILKEEDLEKQRRKRERMRKKQEELERKQRLREEKRLKREAREREKEEKRKLRERKRMERLKAQQEKSQRKKASKKNKTIQSKAEIDDDSNSNFSLSSSITNSIQNNTTNSLNEYDEKEAANILVSLSEDKKSGKKSSSKKQQKGNKSNSLSLTSPIDSDDENSNLSEEDDSKLISSDSSISSSDDEDDEKSMNSLSKNKKLKFKSNSFKKDKQNNKDDSNKNSEPPVKPFKSLAERKAMPPEIMNATTSTPNKPTPSTSTVKKEKVKKRKLDLKNDSLDNLFKPECTLPSIKKPKEKKIKKKITSDYIDTSSSSDSDEKSSSIKKKDKKKKDEHLPKLTVKLPNSRTNSPLPVSSKPSTSSLSSKKDKLNKKEDKKTKKVLLTDKLNIKSSKKYLDKDSRKFSEKLSGSGRFSSKANNNLNFTSNKPVDQSVENRPKKKAKIIITPTKAARKEAAEKGCVLVTQTVSTNDTDEREWICPTCSKPDDGSPMIGCDNCNNWFHWSCLGITQDPAEDSWFCSTCINKQQQIEMKFKKKRKPSDEQEPNSHSNNVSNSRASKPESNKESKHNDKHAEKDHKKLHKKEPVADSKATLTVASTSKNGLENQDLWICPACKFPDDGSPMIGCDGKCDNWFHYLCAGITVEPKDEDKWYCTSCSKEGHKHKKQKKV